MLTTPLRSENRPPIAANVSGVANRSVAANSADHVITTSRFPTLVRGEKAAKEPDERDADRRSIPAA